MRNCGPKGGKVCAAALILMLFAACTGPNTLVETPNIYTKPAS